MHRRTHRKSRNGCGECKRRHVKCDETHPSCVNCKTAKIDCSYTTKTTDHGTFVPFDDGQFSISPPSPNYSNTSHAQDPFGAPLGTYVNLLHLEIFNNFAINENHLLPMDEVSRAQLPLILHHAFNYPLLMCELLACSSMHLSLTHPDLSRRPIYHDEASRLQAEGLMSFNNTIKEITDENVTATFLYSALLGLQAFSSVFTTEAEDLDTFLNRLVHSMRLLHGVNAILAGKWEMVRNSEIGPLLDVEDRSNSSVDEVVHGFQTLRDDISTLSSINKARAHICSEAVEKLAWVYNSRLGSVSADGDANPRMVTTWPIMVSAGFTDLLAERSPEALVVLAYFAVLLHRCRKLWVVGNAGRILLDALEVYLPEEWVGWLAWPRAMIYRSL